MSQEKFDQMLNSLRELGCESNFVILGYSEVKNQTIISIPNEEGESTTKISSNLAKIFTTVLSAAEKQEDGKLFDILFCAFSSATFPYTNGMDENLFTALALSGI